jgi:hypothetical protein
VIKTEKRDKNAPRGTSNYTVTENSAVSKDW